MLVRKCRSLGHCCWEWRLVPLLGKTYVGSSRCQWNIESHTTQYFLCLACISQIKNMLVQMLALEHSWRHCSELWNKTEAVPLIDEWRLHRRVHGNNGMVLTPRNPITQRTISYMILLIYIYLAQVNSQAGKWIRVGPGSGERTMESDCRWCSVFWSCTEAMLWDLGNIQNPLNRVL